MRYLKSILILILFVNYSCNVKYNFTGTGKIDAKTFQVNYFQNTAEIVEPGIERIFTQKLQNVLINQTNLDLVSDNGELVYEGEVVEYRITPMASTSNENFGAAQNRMTIVVNVRYTNKKNEEDNFEKRFSHFYDYEATKLPSDVMNEALEEIYGRITQDVFNASLAKW